MDFYEDEAVPPIEVDADDEIDLEEELGVAELFGMNIFDLPEDFTPTGMVVIVRGLVDGDPEPELRYRSTEGLAWWELRGILAEAIRTVTLEEE